MVNLDDDVEEATGDNVHMQPSQGSGSSTTVQVENRSRLETIKLQYGLEEQTIYRLR